LNVYTSGSLNLIAPLEPDMAKEKKKKNSQLIVRLNKEEKDSFIDLCDDLDTSAAREVRHFIRKFLKQHEEEDS
tara:strand:- start:893 stop:1114 length:222 start_codon:yes stop_codon:yes gene_type:complete